MKQKREREREREAAKSEGVKQGEQCEAEKKTIASDKARSKETKTQTDVLHQQQCVQQRVVSAEARRRSGPPLLPLSRRHASCRGHDGTRPLR